MAQILERVLDAIIRVDKDLNIKYISDGGLRWLGGTSPSMSKLFIDLLHKDDIEIFLDSTQGHPESFECEVRILKDSQFVWTRVRGYELPVVSQYLLCVFDISIWKNSESALIHATEHDSLTGLANRVLLQKTIDNLIQSGTVSFSVALLDLDGFKKVNDTFGHLVGDKILQETSNRLTKIVNSGDTVARLGGDEFVVIIRDELNPVGGADTLVRLLQSIARPYDTEIHEAYLGVSIGVANYPDHGEDYTTLLKNADTAMYQSKFNGKNCITLYSKMVENVDLTVKSAMHNGIHEGEFYLEYQPQFTPNRELVGAEALMRWTSGAFGRISPDKFIPVAEEAGLMPYLGKWALRYACQQLRQFQQIQPEFTMSVNVSPIQFKNEDFHRVVLDATKEANISNLKVILEITESTLMESKDRIEESLRILRQHGIRFAIDDFGTGFSSLAYLTRLPVSGVKIDKAFIRAIGTSADEKLIIAMINLAHGIDLKCVAEGVETEEQLAFLKEHGCDFIQGFLLGKPLPAAEMTKLLKATMKVKT